jgi:transcriptional regulator with XRE-family HTH domain
MRVPVHTDPLDTGVLWKDVGRRLEETRNALEMTQEEFIAGTKMTQASYSPYERQIENRILPAQHALALCHLHNITLDWIYKGDPSGIPAGLWDKIKRNR